MLFSPFGRFARFWFFFLYRGCASFRSAFSAITVFGFMVSTTKSTLELTFYILFLWWVTIIVIETFTLFPSVWQRFLEVSTDTTRDEVGKRNRMLKNRINVAGFHSSHWELTNVHFPLVSKKRPVLENLSSRQSRNVIPRRLSKAPQVRFEFH